MQVVTKTKKHSEKTYRNISYNSIQCQDNHEKHDINKRKVKKIKIQLNILINYFFRSFYIIKRKIMS